SARRVPRSRRPARSSSSDMDSVAMLTLSLRRPHGLPRHPSPHVTNPIENRAIHADVWGTFVSQPENFESDFLEGEPAAELFGRNYLIIGNGHKRRGRSLAFVTGATFSGWHVVFLHAPRGFSWVPLGTWLVIPRGVGVR